MAKIKIKYWLTEKGRKASLLAGGDGKEEQTLTADITEELLEPGGARSDGTAYWDVRYDPDRLHIYWSPRGPEITLKGRTHVNFDAPQTAESLLAYYRDAMAQAAAEKAKLEAQLPDEIEAWKKHEAERETKMAAERAENNRLIDEREVKKAALKAERTAWIADHGSDYLRRATTLGYNCQRQYVEERAATELPDFEVDFNDNAEWRSRSCPSEAALGEVEKLIEAGYKAEIVWLIWSVDKKTDEDGHPEPFDPCEAIVIGEYLDKYDLVKIV